ncbi:transposase [Cognatiluteimonas weifangensis]|uniref:transposase n=1 Tax=Cognatiluteimonas weifangensis TaxID=2303539 RepID=UPI0022792EF4|nr:transposase [Luteimonas weifangensis]
MGPGRDALDRSTVAENGDGGSGDRCGQGRPGSGGGRPAGCRAVRARELDAIDRTLRAQIQLHATPSLRSSKGLSPVFQATALALLPELGYLDRRQIGKPVGVAPRNRDSGQGQGKRSIRGGRAPVRVALHMATLSAVRWDPTMRDRQLRARGKLGKVALVACMRRLLGIVNARRREAASA